MDIVVSREGQVELLAHDIAKTRICGPDPDKDTPALAWEPVAKYAKVDGPGEGLNSTVNGLNNEEVGSLLLIVGYELETAESDLSQCDQSVHEADELALAVDVAQVRQEKSTERVSEQKSRIHVRNRLLCPIVV